MFGGEEMVKESARKCSHCGHNGHNSRTCHGINGKCFKLFGVNIVSASHHRQFTLTLDRTLKKSASMFNLDSLEAEDPHLLESGYSSDGQILPRKTTTAHDRKKGKAWTAAEHMTFLDGLEKLGKGDWRGISKKYVPTRTPTQVASHAQKYFLRQAATDKKKRRSSLFDIPLNKQPVTSLLLISLSNMLFFFISPGFMDLQALDSSVASSSKNSATSFQANISKVLPLKRSVEMPALIANRFPSLCLDGSSVLPIATTGVPSYHGMPFMVENPVHWHAAAIFPSVSLVPVMKYPRAGNLYPHHPHPSGIPAHPLTRAVLHDPYRAGPLSSLPEKDNLDLNIGQPKSSQQAHQASGAISVT